MNRQKIIQAIAIIEEEILKENQIISYLEASKKNLVALRDGEFPDEPILVKAPEEKKI